MRKNERLILIDDSKQWWMVANSANQSGFVPSNYVKKAKTSIFTSIRNTLGRRKGSDAKSQPPAPNVRGNSEDGNLGEPSAPCDNTMAIAKFAYESQQADEMGLLKGDRVMVLEKSSDGWWRGRKDDNQSGWFPSNYVIEEVSASDVGMYAHADRGDGDNKLGDECIEAVVTLYPYTSRNSEELSFEKDEVLDVMDKPLVDPDWWKARNQKGEVGLVPRNYVQMCTDSGYPETTPESQSSSSLSGQSQGASSSRTPSGGFRSRYNVSGPLQEQEWYYGNIPRSECDSLLNQHGQDGDFLIRDSESNVSNACNSKHETLTLCWHNAGPALR